MKYDKAIHKQDDSAPTNNNAKALKTLYGYEGKVLKSNAAADSVACFSEGSDRFVRVDSSNILVDPHKKHNKEEAAKRKKKKQNADTKMISVDTRCFEYYLHYLQTQTEKFLNMAQVLIKNHRGPTGVVHPTGNVFDRMTKGQLAKMGLHRLTND